MTHNKFALGSCLLFTLSPLAQAVAENTVSANRIFEEVIVVTGQAPENTLNNIDVSQAPVLAPDMAALIGRYPGAALVKNGTLSGQIQYRGVFGSRIATRINHQAFHSGGPNLMDPPMHYAPPTLVDSIQVNRGVSDVAFGPSLIGGINTQLKQVPYNDTSEMEFHYDMSMIGRTVDNSHAVGGTLGVSNDIGRLFSLISKEKGNDAEFEDGDINNTFHERQLFGLNSGYKSKIGEFNVELRRQETDESGNAPFAMDIEYVNTDFANVSYAHTVGDLAINAMVGYSDVDHGMNNYAMRPAPVSPMRYRRTLAGAETLMANVKAKLETDSGVLGLGFDLDRGEMYARITNPNNTAFYLDNVPDVDMDRTGLFANWEQSIGASESWRGAIGVRVDRHSAEAGLVQTGNAVPAMPVMLGMAHNKSGKDWGDTTYDMVARMWRVADGALWRFTLARKTRAPGYIERFAWLPTPASAGLADGNNYVGDQNLDAEVAMVAEAGVDLRGSNWWLNPSVYYHQMNDYIQGVPFDATPGVVDSPVEMVSGMNGDPTPLRFGNVDARMYGFDASYGVQFSDRWRIEGALTMVRGERRDIEDDLYRITPDRLSMSLIYDRSVWSLSVETVLTNSQSKVSQSNNEQETSGHGIVNLYANWQPSNQVSVFAGLENLLDKGFANHLNGYNRIGESDIAIGERLPDAGRNLFLRVQFRR